MSRSVNFLVDGVTTFEHGPLQLEASVALSVRRRFAELEVEPPDRLQTSLER